MGAVSPVPGRWTLGPQNVATTRRMRDHGPRSCQLADDAMSGGRTMGAATPDLGATASIVTLGGWRSIGRITHTGDAVDHGRTVWASAICASGGAPP